MLDENLPVFFLNPSNAGVKHHNEFYLSHHGSEPEPAYHLERADPASPSPSYKNCYAAALFDAYNPEILFGEALAKPEWTTPSATPAQGGVPPAPQPILPNEFTIQLYNPDQQIRVEMKTSKWTGQDSFEFSMPQDVFRMPSHSNLDKGASDPASLEVTPRINFVWRKDGRLNKDLTCFLTGKNTDQKKKNSRKDPDISIALWRGMRELTLYEPNLCRVEMEDPKGLEVVLLLTAVVIKDLYFTPKDQLRELFNISGGLVSPRRQSGGGRKASNPVSMYAGAPLQPPTAADTNANKRWSLPRLQTTPDPQGQEYVAAANIPPPFPDARTQWELEAETARLKAQQEQERAEAQRRKREQEKKDEAERKRLQKMVEEEEKAARKKQAEIEKETERLRKLYGVTPIPNYQPRPPQPAPAPPNGYNGYTPRQVHSRPYLAPATGPWMQPPGPYLQSSASASNLHMAAGPSGTGGLSVPNANSNLKKKSSFWR